MKPLFTVKLSNLRFLVALGLVLTFVSSLGQIKVPEEIKERNPRKMKHLAEHAIKLGDTYTAVFYYQLIVKKTPEDVEAHYHLAELHRLTRNYKEAEIHYKEVGEKAPSEFPLALYYEAIMQKMMGNYDTAQANLNSFLKGAKNFGDKNFVRHIRKEIQGCDVGKAGMEFPNNYEIIHLNKDINHPHAEFSPLALDSTHMIFGSLRMDTMAFYDFSFDHKETQPHRKLYTATYNGDEWEEDGEFNGLSDEEYDLGKVAYSPLSKRYYFTKCLHDEKNHVQCQLYVASTKNGQIEEIEKLPAPINVEEFSSTQPTIRFDTARKIEYLYFVSDRPGGQGGKDIYYSYFNKRKKQWKAPKNMGRLVNTPYTECTPYFDNTGKALYFSSDGHASMGGLDVFKSVVIDGRFNKAINLGFPVNSPQDELDFVLDKDTTHGFLVSNRVGGTPYFHETCCDDIYTFEALQPQPFECVLHLAVKAPENKLINDIPMADSTSTVDSLALLDSPAVTDTMSVDSTVLVNGIAQPDTTITDSLLINGIASADTIPVDSVALTGGVLYLLSVEDLEHHTTTYDTIYPVDGEIQLPLDKDRRYTIIASEDGYITDSITFNTGHSATTDRIDRDLVLEKVEEEIILELPKEKPTEDKPFVLKNVQYEYNSAELTEKGKKELDQVLIPYLNENPDFKVVIMSHTDNIGSKKYNQNLSQRRAQSVVVHLISNGIDESRLEAKGYGESKPIAPNELPDGSDNPIGRSLNRRTDFSVVE